MRRKQLAFWGLLFFLATTVSLALLELFLHFFPVNDGTHRLSVNEANPILRFHPNRQFVWSKGWDLSLVNVVQTNNFGFVSDYDYFRDGSSPLLAVIGDSFVEAMMVPFNKTATGRLAKHLNDTGRVYSFGVSGAPLSQYLAYSAYVRRTFNAEGIVIVVVGNDFDESLKKYNAVPGHHYFVEDDHEELKVERVDFSPGFFKRLIRASALGRYVALNLGVLERLNRLGDLFEQEDEKKIYVGNTSSNTDPLRIEDSKRAVNTFLKELPTASGLTPTKILFVVDGMRPHLYDDLTFESAKGSYFDLMRRYFITSATAKGYEVIDMEPIFRNHHKKNEERFDFHNDMHWNVLGHELCFEAIIHSPFFSRFHKTDHLSKLTGYSKEHLLRIPKR